MIGRVTDFDGATACQAYKTNSSEGSIFSKSFWMNFQGPHEYVFISRLVASGVYLNLKFRRIIIEAGKILKSCRFILASKLTVSLLSPWKLKIWSQIYGRIHGFGYNVIIGLKSLLKFQEDRWNTPATVDFHYEIWF